MLTKEKVQKIIVACDAGIGSSAMDATILRKKTAQAGLAIEMLNCAINDLPEEMDIVITHHDLTSCAKQIRPQGTHSSLVNFLDSQFYDGLIQSLMVNNAVDIKEDEQALELAQRL